MLVLMARTSTYLNFPRTTEPAFLYYPSEFGGDFGTKGPQRFRDIPSSQGNPPIAEADLDLIMHIELPITGGHILMGTDAPESMGFTVNQGNNIHNSLEPDTCEETR